MRIPQTAPDPPPAVILPVLSTARTAKAATLAALMSLAALVPVAVVPTPAAAAAPVAPPPLTTPATTPVAPGPPTALPEAGATSGTSPQAMPHYRLLERALDNYRVLAADPTLTALPRLPRRAVKPGERWEGLPALRRLLAALGDLPAPGPVPSPVPSPVPLQEAGPARSAPAPIPAIPPRVSPAAPPGSSSTPTPAAPAPSAATSPSPSPAQDPATLHDPVLVAALQRFQARHGLETDGVLGPATWRALTTPLASRVRQIERTLEHWRALPANPHRRAIFINIPRFRLYAVSGFTVSEAQMLRIDVVVGRAVKELRTPVFTADMTHVIFRPYWEVPASIARQEIVPAARRDAQYLARNHFELVDRAGRIVAASDAALAQLQAGSLRVRQRPGADNALGAVKFMLPNAHNVYLHDTPARTLFARSRRDFSHGCIRVADPVALAQFVLQEDPAWTPERITAAMAGTEPLRVDLAEPIRVYIVYGTAIAREDGTVLFLEDLYGLERR